MGVTVVVMEEIDTGGLLVLNVIHALLISGWEIFDVVAERGDVQWVKSKSIGMVISA